MKKFGIKKGVKTHFGAPLVGATVPRVAGHWFALCLLGVNRDCRLQLEGLAMQSDFWFTTCRGLRRETWNAHCAKRRCRSCEPRPSTAQLGRRQLLLGPPPQMLPACLAGWWGAAQAAAAERAFAALYLASACLRAWESHAAAHLLTRGCSHSTHPAKRDTHHQTILISEPFLGKFILIWFSWQIVAWCDVKSKIILFEGFFQTNIAYFVSISSYIYNVKCVFFCCGKALCINVLPITN